MFDPEAEALDSGENFDGGLCLLEWLGVRVEVTDTIMTTRADKQALARAVFVVRHVDCAPIGVISY